MLSTPRPWRALPSILPLCVCCTSGIAHPKHARIVRAVIVGVLIGLRVAHPAADEEAVVEVRLLAHCKAAAGMRAGEEKKKKNRDNASRRNPVSIRYIRVDCCVVLVKGCVDGIGGRAKKALPRSRVISTPPALVAVAITTSVTVVCTYLSLGERGNRGKSCGGSHGVCVVCRCLLCWFARDDGIDGIKVRA
jgi:hypothetical protein